MRTAQLLKLFAYGVIALGILFASKFFSPVSVGFWTVIFLSVLLWLILRLLAGLGQFIFEIKNDIARMLANIERGLHYSNSLTKEIRDMVDAEGTEKKAS